MTSFAQSSPHWIRSPRFDSALIACGLVAVGSGFLVVEHPRLFMPILLVDVWLLGSQHVIATYTRLCFDTHSLKKHWFLVFALPWLVFALVAAGILTGGRYLITTIYLYWQWAHYTQQSYFIGRLYLCKSPPLGAVNDALTTLMMFSVPLWGILYRSWQYRQIPGGQFLGSKFYALPVPFWLVVAVGLVAFLSLAWWIAMQLGLWIDGKFSAPAATYIASHTAVFIVGYYVIGDITAGWLVANVWHNMQYILLVWNYNNRRFGDAVHPRHKLLSFISQKEFLWLYVLLCMALTIGFYSPAHNFDHPPLGRRS
ncbi:hypothetical protein DYH09_31130 [bacterium CPR1]|nr:hypothetical protein [bacterium CPR1]